MDPDACLTEIRELIALHQEQHDGLDEDQTSRLVELIEELDDWIALNRGFPPRPWAPVSIPEARRWMR